MASNDVDYYRQRAVEERAMVKTAADSSIAMIHLQLAEEYEALVKEPALRRPLRVVRDGDPSPV